MAYAKIDDGILDHPKCLMAGEDATNLFIRSIIWCNKHLTDGFVPHEACTNLTRSRNLKKQVAALLRVGLWEEVEGGYRIVGFLDHNDSKEEVQRKRELAAERQRRSRARRAQQSEEGSASVRRDKRVTSPSVTAPTPLNLINPPIPPASGGRDMGDPPQDPPEVRRVMTSVLKRMAELSGATFSDSAELRARILEGHSEEDLIAVVESQWQREFMRNKREFFRPRTLFSPRHFAEYLAIAKAQPAEDEEPAYGTAPRRYF